MIAFPAESGSMKKRACRAGLTMGLVLCAGAALADVPLAAPGECAQAREPLVTQPVQVMPAAVAGRATDAFAPIEPPSEERPRTLTDLLGLTGTNTASKTSPDATVGPVSVRLDASETAVRVETPLLDAKVDTDVKSLFDTQVNVGTNPLPLDMQVNLETNPLLDTQVNLETNPLPLDTQVNLDTHQLLDTQVNLDTHQLLDTNPLLDTQSTLDTVNDLLGGGR